MAIAPPLLRTPLLAHCPIQARKLSAANVGRNSFKLRFDQARDQARYIANTT